ncbi:uncharacterized protein LOC111322412 [Stylophora pistillata]|uniref:uncharacterized protein LOC111322412 n=1 Tax=Stylophora pistillata TaxID=50429 RepID=UPI000C050038|nr:uncharacterized protein LOC111322412 [Stylophora pistillata]
MYLRLVCVFLLNSLTRGLGQALNEDGSITFQNETVCTTTEQNVLKIDCKISLPNNTVAVDGVEFWLFGQDSKKEVTGRLARGLLNSSGLEQFAVDPQVVGNFSLQKATISLTVKLSKLTTGQFQAKTSFGIHLSETTLTSHPVVMKKVIVVVSAQEKYPNATDKIIRHRHDKLFVIKYSNTCTAGLTPTPTPTPTSTSTSPSISEAVNVTVSCQLTHPPSKQKDIVAKGTTLLVVYIAGPIVVVMIVVLLWYLKRKKERSYALAVDMRYSD